MTNSIIKRFNWAPVAFPVYSRRCIHVFQGDPGNTDRPHYIYTAVSLSNGETNTWDYPNVYSDNSIIPT